MDKLIQENPFDFNADGQVVVGQITLTDAQMWDLIEQFTDSVCPCCGTGINQHEIVCNNCLEKAELDRRENK